MKKILKFIGGRKVLISFLAFTSSTILLVVGKISADDFTNIVKALIVIYPAANIGQRFISKTDITSQNIEQGIKNLNGTWPTGRKFIFNLVLFITISILTGFSIITSEIYTSITIWLISFYNASNVVSKIRN